MFLLLYRQTDDAVIGRLSEHLRRFSKSCPKVIEDCRRNSKMFQPYTNEFKYNLRDKLEISKSNDILISEDVENMNIKI